MSAAVGFKLRARNMTALGVQVVGTDLNKTVSTGDNLWGLPWANLPPVSRCMGLEISGLWIYLLFCTGWNYTWRSVSRTGHCVQGSEDGAALSCIMDPGVDSEEPVWI